jgi:hypothetical protein
VNNQAHFTIHLIYVGIMLLINLINTWEYSKLRTNGTRYFWIRFVVSVVALAIFIAINKVIDNSGFSPVRNFFSFFFENITVQATILL